MSTCTHCTRWFRENGSQLCEACAVYFASLGGEPEREDEE